MNIALALFSLDEQSIGATIAPLSLSRIQTYGVAHFYISFVEGKA
jgi:hypothetical protein